ncbi:MAG: hypothetical protein HN348_12675 [Proteobacteria bacterium]|nr:hypothetical protein [Pseudomonadota bacterium]
MRALQSEAEVNLDELWRSTFKECSNHQRLIGPEAFGYIKSELVLACFLQ